MKSHIKKLIVPIVITFLMFLYFIGLASGFIFAKGIPLWLTIIGVLIPLLLAVISICMLIERINEIRSGEEDDLSKY